MTKDQTWYLDFEGRVTTSVATDSAPGHPYPRAWASTPVSRWDVAWRVALLVVLAWLAWETRSVARATEANGRIQAALAADGDGR